MAKKVPKEIAEKLKSLEFNDVSFTKASSGEKRFYNGNAGDYHFTIGSRKGGIFGGEKYNLSLSKKDSETEFYSGKDVEELYNVLASKAEPVLAEMEARRKKPVYNRIEDIVGMYERLNGKDYGKDGVVNKHATGSKWYTLYVSHPNYVKVSSGGRASVWHYERDAIVTYETEDSEDHWARCNITVRTPEAMYDAEHLSSVWEQEFGRNTTSIREERDDPFEAKKGESIEIEFTAPDSAKPEGTYAVFDKNALKMTFLGKEPAGKDRSCGGDTVYKYRAECVAEGNTEIELSSAENPRRKARVQLKIE